MITIFVDLNFGIECFRAKNKNHFLFTLGPHLWDSRFAADTIQSELAYKNPYTMSISAMKIKFLELQDNDKKAKKPRLEGLSEGQEDIKEVLHD